MRAHNVTIHAASRMQQRAVPQFVVDLLFMCGSSLRSHGADRLIFDKAAIRRLRRHLGGDRGIRLIDRWLNIYAVVANDGALITVAHQTRHHRRP